MDQPCHFDDLSLADQLWLVAHTAETLLPVGTIQAIQRAGDLTEEISWLADKQVQTGLADPWKRTKPSGGTSGRPSAQRRPLTVENDGPLVPQHHGAAGRMARAGGRGPTNERPAARRRKGEPDGSPSPVGTAGFEPATP
jgi:hypothetical protein